MNIIDVNMHRCSQIYFPTKHKSLANVMNVLLLHFHIQLDPFLNNLIMI